MTYYAIEIVGREACGGTPAQVHITVYKNPGSRSQSVLRERVKLQEW